jgi:hypothetical protein
MPLDPAILGNLAAEQMAALEENFGNEDVQIVGAITIVEVLRVHTRDAEGNPVAGQSDIRMRVNIGDPFHVMGVLEQAKQQIASGPGFGAPPE